MGVERVCVKLGSDVYFGDDVVIGDLAVVHALHVGSRTLIGIGAIVEKHTELRSRHSQSDISNIATIPRSSPS